MLLHVFQYFLFKKKLPAFGCHHLWLVSCTTNLATSDVSDLNFQCDCDERLYPFHGPFSIYNRYRRTGSLLLLPAGISLYNRASPLTQPVFQRCEISIVMSLDCRFLSRPDYLSTSIEFSRQRNKQAENHYYLLLFFQPKLHQHVSIS